MGKKKLRNYWSDFEMSAQVGGIICCRNSVPHKLWPRRGSCIQDGNRTKSVVWKSKSCCKNIPECFENLAGPAFLREAGEHHQMCRHHRRSGCRICLASNRLQPFGCSSWSWFEGNPGVALDNRGRGTSSQAPENKRLGQLMPSFWLAVGISGKAYGCSC